MTSNMTKIADKTCEFCGEFFPFPKERNKHKCPYFIQETSSKKEISVSSSSTSASLPFSPVKPDNYKLSLIGGRLEMKANYRCDLCHPNLNQIFSTAEEFTKHKTLMHCITRKELTEKKKLLSRRIQVLNNSGSIKCEKCEIRFTDSIEYRRHLIEIHLSPRGNRNRIMSHLELVEILKSNSHGRSQEIDDESQGIRLDEYKCALCREKFVEKSQLFDHTAEIHRKMLMYECNKCAQMFVHRLALTRHLQSHKEINEIFSPQEAFECEFCGKQFTFESYYKRHLATHTGASFFTCDICGDDFRSQNQLVLHRSDHTGDERFSCPKCKKKFAYNSMLERHYKTHVGEPESCTVCGKSFNVQSLLQKHVVVEHSDADKLQACPECGKKFLYPSYLERHMLTHSLMISKSQKCPLCPKRFAQRANLLHHLQNHVPKITKPQTPYQCPVCSKPYKRESTLDKHLRTFHCVGDSNSASMLDEEQLMMSGQQTTDTFRLDLHHGGQSRLIRTNRIRTNAGKEYLAVPLEELQEDRQALSLHNVQVSVQYLE